MRAGQQGGRLRIGDGRTLIKDCPNLYGYVLGGGDASGGGNASIGRVELTVSGSKAPVADMGKSRRRRCFTAAERPRGRVPTRRWGA